MAVANDKCPHCESTNTERIDTAVDEPEFTIWIVQCGNCAECFEVVVEKDEGQS